MDVPLPDLLSPLMTCIVCHDSDLSDVMSALVEVQKLLTRGMSPACDYGCLSLTINNRIAVPVVAGVEHPVS